MFDHKEHLDEIAGAAAALYGQDWKALSMPTRERWLETVRNTSRGSVGVNYMESCAGQAIDEWYKKKEAQPIAEPEPVESLEAPPKQKTKTKK